MTIKRLLLIISLSFFLIAFPHIASSQGIYVHPDRGSRDALLNPSSGGPVLLKDRKVLAEIVEAGVTVEVSETFHNSSSSVLEGTYVFPLPRGAAAAGLSLFINGTEVKGEVLSADKARGVYNDIVRKARDPALLEYVDEGLLRASVYPINPLSDVTVKLKYVASIDKSGSQYHFGFPLKSSAAGSPDTLINVHIRSKLPVRNLYSPTHEIDIARSSDYEARVTYEGKDKPRKNFSLYYSLAAGEFGISLLTHAAPGGDNFFLCMLSPRLKVEGAKILPKDVVFVIDKSGSMAGEKWRQAKHALKYCIQSLHPEDRFGLLAFSTEALAYKSGLVNADAGEKEKAAVFLDGLNAAGGTNIHEALKGALDLLAPSERLCMVAFLTDGLPTVGVTDVDQIIRDVKAANKKSLRIFNFGVGYDVNTYLLGHLAESTRGSVDYIEEGENIEVKVSSFYSKISDPILSNVKVAFEGINAFEVYPKKMDDLFAGSCLMVVGRYEGEDKGSIVLSGEVRGEERRFTFSGGFAAMEKENDFLPAYWAMRKIGYLLNEIRLHGLNDELKDEVIALGRKYGLVTPYTSALVVEEGMRLAQAVDDPAIMNTPLGRGRISFHSVDDDEVEISEEIIEMAAEADAAEKLSELAGVNEEKPAVIGVGGSGGGTHGKKAVGKGGKESVLLAKNLNRLAKKGVYARGKTLQKGEPDVVRVGALTFHRLGGLYVDSRYDEGMKDGLTEIESYSEEYFELLVEHPDLKKVFALGERVIFVLDGKAYWIKPAEEKEKSDG